MLHAGFFLLVRISPPPTSLPYPSSPLPTTSTRYYSPGYSEKLLERVEQYKPQN